MFYMYKLLFLSTLCIGSLISISSYTWMGMWLGLEINLLSIIPLMVNSKNLLNNESTIKYFITQAMASTILLFSVILMSSKIMDSWENNLNMIFNTSLLTKMGTAPFHFWFPEVMEGLNWFNCLLLLTWQKLTPMVLLLYNNNMMIFFSIIIMISMLISGIMGLNQISLRKILAYSSINHMAWMISSFFFMENIWIIYFMIYFITSINIILIFKYLNVFYMKQLFLSLNQNKILKIFFIMNFLSLGGLPPFLGFLPKWLTINILTQNNLLFLTLLMLMMTLLTLYFYMRITFSSLMIIMSETNFYKMIHMKQFNILLFNFLTLNSLIISTLIFNFY
uniref:NADH-ubiquinone oxidoreductase chain 2 n=1 Tax=Ochthebius remotus TaxID=1309317 RepID=A0A7H0DJY9_9COLE|nr:NADH dehydrogenase subunit 2 [Ochthebius remotus]QNP09649.1 NADH dehydrogenase subunit 2 [Ochthebius remotus]